ncbi:hypothetical protein GIB67_003070 [Kingdonia uniflora]|uniref:Kinesin motor domain-containing protein n=1 Tax=Kingdonia uniflora TaxID=39325 RepID=A0A7J7N668_9MAGN|nr:hypothetical protein GIB67_003070 [Kingdonia uniflora]
MEAMEHWDESMCVKPSRSLVGQRSTNRIKSRVSPASPVKPGRHFDMSVVTENGKLDDAVVGALVETMLDQKENIDHELCASFRNRNTDSLKLLSKILPGSLQKPLNQRCEIMLEKRQLHTLVYSGSTRKGPYGNGGLSHPDATMHHVKSTNDVLNPMKLCEMNRFVSSTALNNRCSRSHSILTISVQGKDSSGSIQCSLPESSRSCWE